ncbi:trichohyalin isoform X2 [Lucilia cuprina]|uniref:trichohyalin isoform X2 n=1 Tax=Lucilia cuprina TaxID=7375 RepID=UPI001F051B12|nr:trichohyalin isoform X2 [Lucilia cuprina]
MSMKMKGKSHYMLLLQLLVMLATTTNCWGQRSPFSLQAAVDELHRQEYPLNAPPVQQSHFMAGAFGSSPDQDYWEEDDMPASLFRERETQDMPDHSELTDQFLREIEKAQEHERQDRYKDALRNLWEKYQQQENQIEGDIYEEQKKRMRMPPYYMLMQRKRSYPVLPWLPYNADRKKRFPVSKRSTTHMNNDSPALSNLEKTDENVEKELSELFGSATDEKKKRSIDSSHSKASTTHAPESETATTTDMRLEVGNSPKNNNTEENVKRSAVNTQHEADHHQHAGHSLKEHKHGKRSNHGTSHESHEDEGEEEEEDSDEEHDSDEEEEEHEHEHDHEEHEDDEEEAKRKKKRNATTSKKKRNVETLRRTIDDFNIMRSKKSIDWSKYFGLDRKKKAMPVVNDNKDDEMKKRNTDEDTSVEDINKKKKRKLDPAKLDNMNKKLQAIEDFIINETIKYTGAHEGIDNPEEIQRLKDRVLSRLATAYSLEKMRRALEKLRQSVDNENHLMRNIIDPDADNSLENNSLEAVKKDKSPAKAQSLKSEDTEEDAMKKKMKKSNGFMRYPDVANEFGEFEDTLQSPNRYETLNDAYLGNKNYILGTNQCPIIESMAERCRGVDLLSGDVNQELLPLCGVHQLCYLCGTSQIACDYQYLSEADAVCGNNNNECQAAARSVLMILRGTPGPQLGPRECIKNSCLYSAMREIGL